MSGLNVARWALVFLCVLGSVGSPSLAANSGPSPTVLIADDYLLRLAAAFPEAGTANDLPGTDHGALSDNSLQGLARWQAYEDATIARLLATPVGASGPESDLILRAALLDDLQRNAGVRVCRLELWGVASYVNGWQAWLTDLARIQPVGTAAHRESALRRARAIPRYLDNEISLLELGLREGYSSPKVIVREVIVQLDGLLAAEPAKSPFSAPAERDADPAFKAAYVAVVRDEINPAVRRYRDFLEKTYLPAARDALGVSANPNGRACYDAVVRQFSTVAMPADEVYETGQRELRRLDEEMRPLAQKLAGTDDVTQAMRVVTTDPRFMFRSSDAVIAYAQAAQDRALAAMPRAFGVYTRVPVKIEPYPEFRARAGAPGQYMPPPEDGSRPPIHLINTWDPTHKSRSIVESTTFHETWPGHHQQTMVAREAERQVPRRPHGARLGHPHARHGLRGGDRAAHTALHAHARRSARRGESLHLVAGPGAVVHDRQSRDPAPARRRPRGHGRALRRPRVPRPGAHARQRHVAAPAPAGGGVGRAREAGAAVRERAIAQRSTVSSRRRHRASAGVAPRHPGRAWSRPSAATRELSAARS